MRLRIHIKLDLLIALISYDLEMLEFKIHDISKRRVLSEVESREDALAIMLHHFNEPLTKILIEVEVNRIPMNAVRFESGNARNHIQ